MKRTVVRLLTAGALAIPALLASAGSSHAHILRVADGRYAALPEMIADLRQARLVFIGELHDRVGHHEAQLQVIRSLHEAGTPVAIALEMFRSDSQRWLDDWVAGRLSEKDFLRVYNDNWSMWPKYRDIFEYARREKLSMLGLNIPRQITRQVAKNGMKSLSPQQMDALPRVRCDVDSRYQERIRSILGGHNLEETQFLHFCEAQLLWDSVMAETLLDYIELHPDTTIVVLAGSSHAWKYGIPEQVQRRTAIEMRILLPEVTGRIGRENVTANQADYLLLGIDEAPLH